MASLFMKMLGSEHYVLLRSLCENRNQCNFVASGSSAGKSWSSVGRIISGGNLSVGYKKNAMA